MLPGALLKNTAGLSAGAILRASKEPFGDVMVFGRSAPSFGRWASIGVANSRKFASADCAEFFHIEQSTAGC